MSRIIENIKSCSNEVHDVFLSIGQENITNLFDITNYFGEVKEMFGQVVVRFDYCPRRTLNHPFKSMVSYYRTCIIHTLYTIGYLRMCGLGLRTLVKELGISKNEFKDIFGFNLN